MQTYAQTHVIMPEDSPMDAAVKMAEGNPGAATVIGRMLTADPVMGFVYLCHADDMGVRGCRLWLAYRDFAKDDMDVLATALQDHDPALLAVLEREGYPVEP